MVEFKQRTQSAKPVDPDVSSEASTDRSFDLSRWHLSRVAGAVSAAALVSCWSLKERAEGGFTDPSIPPEVYTEKAKEHVGPIRWEERSDGSWFQRGGCVYVKIFFTDPNTQKPSEVIASGVIINDRTVVTAAHVADFGMESGGPPPSNRTVCIGWSPNCFGAPVGKMTSDEVRVTECHIHPDYFRLGPANAPDCAVLITEKPIMDPATQARSGATFFPTEPAQTDDPLLLCGYGLTNNDLDTGDARAGYARKSMTRPLLGYSAELYESSDSVAARPPRLSGHIYDSGGLVSGDSTVIGIDGQPEKRTVIYGHMVTATRSGLGATDYLDYSNQLNRLFIEQHMKVELPVPDMKVEDGKILLSWPATSYNVGVKVSSDLTSWEPLYAPVSVDQSTGRHTMTVGTKNDSVGRRFFQLYNRLK